MLIFKKSLKNQRKNAEKIFRRFFYFILRKKNFLKKFLEQKLIDFSTKFYAAESEEIKESRYFIAFCFTCNNFSGKMILERRKEDYATWKHAHKRYPLD